MRHLKATFAVGSIAAALLAAPGFAAAAIPTGSFEIEFGGLQSIWAGDVDADYGEEFCTDFATQFDDLEFCDFQVFVDGKGKVFGSFEFSGWSGGLHFAEGGSIKGSQKGDDRSGISHFSFTIKLTGVATDGVDTLPTKSSIRYSGQVTADGFLTGVWDQSVCVKGFECNVSQTPAPAEILTDGGWSLELEISDGGGGRLGGSARVEFGGGGECFYAVSGKYSSKKDVASLSLVPTESDCAGTSLRLKDVRLSPGMPDDLLGSIDYRLFGFTGATPFGDLPGSLGQILYEYDSTNQVLYAFICSGTTAIAASVDPGACSWSIIGSAPMQSGASATITAVSLPPLP